MPVNRVYPLKDVASFRNRPIVCSCPERELNLEMMHSPAKSILCRFFFKKNAADICNTLEQIIFAVTLRFACEWKPVEPA